MPRCHVPNVVLYQAELYSDTCFHWSFPGLFGTIQETILRFLTAIEYICSPNPRNFPGVSPEFGQRKRVRVGTVFTAAFA